MSDLCVFSFSWLGFMFLLKRNCDFYMYVICEGYLWICIFFLMESSRVLGECEEGCICGERYHIYLSLSLSSVPGREMGVSLVRKREEREMGDKSNEKWVWA